MGQSDAVSKKQGVSAGQRGPDALRLLRVSIGFGEFNFSARMCFEKHEVSSVVSKTSN